MPQGRSLHIGLNAVDPNRYEGWSGPLNSCVNDARDMEEFARARGFRTTTLLNENATRGSVLEALGDALGALGRGDMLLVTYSGHGGETPDWNGDEGDGIDETWCLRDGQLIDDELWHLWVGAAAGLRIVVLSDSCNSGTVVKMMDGSVLPLELPGVKAMPRALAGRVYRKNRALYDGLALRPSADLASLGASVLLLSGSQDGAPSYDGIGNSQFTGALLQACTRDMPDDYRHLHRRLRNQLLPRQDPNLLVLGSNTGALVAQVPFTI